MNDPRTRSVRAEGATPTPRTVLVLGAGGREHAICWRLAGDPGVERVLVGPGNPLMSDVADVRPDLPAADARAVLDLCRAEAVDLVVIGPEAPLVGGLIDALAAAGVAAFGPGAAAARLEASKAFARSVAAAAGVPMARGAAFTALGPALAFAATFPGGCVVKADGLAGGKGVTICSDAEAAEPALQRALLEDHFGEAGRRVVVEELLGGAEVSLICLCDTTTVLALPAARDHKRLVDGDAGPNTGGMGAFSPLADLDAGLAAELVARVHGPVLAEMARRGTPFRGALYAGLMLTADGPRLLEFNVRLGDPEAQVILPRLATPLAPLLAAAAADRLAEAAAALGIAGPLLPVEPEAAVGVVLAAEGYPERPRSGDPIRGLAAARAEGGMVFGAGLAAALDGSLRTAGGRVLTVVGRGASLTAAATAAYAAADQIGFSGLQRRDDIGRPRTARVGGAVAEAAAPVGAPA